MKKNILVFLLISVVIGVNAQTIKPDSDTAKVAKQIIIDDEDDEILDPVESWPESWPIFKGGEKLMLRYLNMNLIYPKTARKKGVEGRVIVRFVVERSGKISKIKIIRGLGYGCDEEAIRLIQKMPRWKPGRQAGKPVDVWYTLPIMFNFKK